MKEEKEEKYAEKYIYEISSIIEEKKCSFQNLIDEIGLTIYTFKAFFIVSLYFLSEGGQVIIFSLIKIKLSHDWNLSELEKGLLGSYIFIGIYVGSFISGALSDKNGRKPIIISGSFLVTLFAFLSTIAPNYITLSLFRFISGFGFGISVPAIMSLFTEITPTNYRSWLLIGVWIMFPFGEAYVILITKYCIELEDGIKYIYFLSSIPCLIAFFFFFFLCESPKFYLSNHQFEECFIGIRKIVNSSKNKILFNSEKEKELTDETKNNQLNDIIPEYSVLLNKNFKKLSLIVWILFLFNSFLYYGAIHVIPQFLTDNKSGDKRDIYLDLIWTVFSEVPALIIASSICNFEWIGRIKAMILGYFIIFFSIVGVIFTNYFTFFASLMKGGMNFPICIIIVYTCEAYPTKMRSLAFGVGNSFAKIGSIVAPLISQYIFDYDNYLIFVFYALLSSFCIALNLLLPYDTHNKNVN